MTNGDKYNKKKKYKVNILGEELTVTGDVSQEYIEKVAKYINRVGNDINSAYPCLPRRKLLGLATVNVADELFKLKQNSLQMKKENRQLKKENENLRNKIDSLQNDYRELSVLLEEVDS